MKSFFRFDFVFQAVPATGSTGPKLPRFCCLLISWTIRGTTTTFTILGGGTGRPTILKVRLNRVDPPGIARTRSWRPTRMGEEGVAATLSHTAILPTSTAKYLCRDPTRCRASSNTRSPSRAKPSARSISSTQPIPVTVMKLFIQTSDEFVFVLFLFYCARHS